MKKAILSLIVLGLFLAACAPGETPVPPAPAATQAAEAPATLPSATPPPAATSTPVPSPTVIPPTPTDTAVPALPADPQPVDFQAADGQALQGWFYPADRLNAPVVVMIHWVMGDQADWYEVAPWLQNRGLQNPFPNPGGLPVWDPSWFPPVQQGVSYNVFIFSLRGCKPFQEGCTKIDEKGWLSDVQAALLAARDLQGVDSTRIATIGSSIGADGAADGCAWLEEQAPGTCRGALSLSPGDYLGIPYLRVVRQLSEAAAPVPAWCLADRLEVGTCKAAGDYPTYQAIEIPDGGHGTMLLSPELEPLPMQLILDFLAQVFP